MSPRATVCLLLVSAALAVASVTVAVAPPTGGSARSVLAAAVAPREGDRECTGNGAGGWTFRARVSDHYGLVLQDSAFQGRKYTSSVSVPYLVGLTHPARASRDREDKLELTPEPALAHPGVAGSTLDAFECQSYGDGDIYVRATYRVQDFVFGRPAPGGLTVTQEYRFGGLDPAHACEPTGKFSCGRFWPSLSYSSSDATACVGALGSGADCTRFAGMQTVQRLEFAPDGNGQAVDAFRDRPAPRRGGIDGVETKGSDGSMKYEDVDTAIREGGRGDWDSIHLSPFDKTTLPGTNILDLTPGCPSCVHMHWAWGDVVNRFPLGRPPFTDGKPEIRDRSRQTADFGIVRAEPARPDEADPVVPGWRALVDTKKSEPSMLRGHSPVIFWEMRSQDASDAAFPVLDDYRHGGNGSLFFGGAHQH